jgi:hypothetical protein
MFTISKTANGWVVVNPAGVAVTGGMRLKRDATEAAAKANGADRGPGSLAHLLACHEAQG